MPQTLIPICHCSLENVLHQGISLWTWETTKKCTPPHPPSIKANSPFSRTNAHLCSCPAGVTLTWLRVLQRLEVYLSCHGCGVLVYNLATRPAAWGLQEHQPRSPRSSCLHRRSGRRCLSWPRTAAAAAGWVPSSSEHSGCVSQVFATQ